MKLKVKKDALIAGIDKVAGIIGTRTTLPILSNVLVEANGGKLRLTTTDLEIRIATDIDAEIQDTGKTTVPVKKFQSVIREIPDAEVQIESGQGGDITIQYGKGKSKLHTLAPDEFPVQQELAVLRSFRCQQADLSRMLLQIVYSASKDDSRKVLNGILFNVKENNFTVVATDGKRLALAEKHLENQQGGEGDCIIPAKTASELQRILEKQGETVIEIGENQAKFTVGRTIVLTKLVEGNYPNYRQVIPTSFSRRFEVSTEEFLSAMRRVVIHVSDTSTFVKMSVGNNILQLSAVSNEVGEGEEKIDVNYSGAEMLVSFNPQFLMEPLKVVDADKTVFQMNEGYSPVMLSAGEGFLYVIMPVRTK